MLGHGGSSAGSYIADPTSPIPSHCACHYTVSTCCSASIVVTSTVRVKYVYSITDFKLVVCWQCRVFVVLRWMSDYCFFIDVCLLICPSICYHFSTQTMNFTVLFSNIYSLVISMKLIQIFREIWLIVQVEGFLNSDNVYSLKSIFSSYDFNWTYFYQCFIIWEKKVSCSASLISEAFKLFMKWLCIGIMNRLLKFVFDNNNIITYTVQKVSTHHANLPLEMYSFT